MTLYADLDDFLFLSISWKKIGSDGVGGVAEWLRALTDLSEDWSSLQSQRSH